MRRVALLGSVLTLAGLVLVGVTRADEPVAPGPCVPGMRADGVFVVCGDRVAPSATYVIPRSRPDHRLPELRPRFTDEIVRSGDRL